MQYVYTTNPRLPCPPLPAPRPLPSSVDPRSRWPAATLSSSPPGSIRAGRRPPACRHCSCPVHRPWRRVLSVLGLRESEHVWCDVEKDRQQSKQVRPRLSENERPGMCVRDANTKAAGRIWLTALAGKGQPIGDASHIYSPPPHHRAAGRICREPSRRIFKRASQRPSILLLGLGGFSAVRQPQTIGGHLDFMPQRIDAGQDE